MLIGAVAWPTTHPVTAAAADLSRLGCEMPERPSRPAVRLHLIDRAAIRADTRGVLMVESLRPWQAAGVAIEWADAPPDGRRTAGAEDLYVILLPDDGAAATRPQPMASIRFDAGRPTTHITVHAGYVARLLAGEHLDGRPLTDHPRLVADRALGRVLGRAIAHEIGHFVLGSPAHTRTGLMRASHRLEHLLGGADPRFAVTLPAMPTCLVARAAVP